MAPSSVVTAALRHGLRPVQTRPGRRRVRTRMEIGLRQGPQL